MKSSERRLGRVFVLRLEDGDRAPGCLERFGAEKGIAASHVVSVGAVSRCCHATGKMSPLSHRDSVIPPSRPPAGGRPQSGPSGAGRMELPHGTSFHTGGTRIRIRGDKVAVASGGERIAVV